MDSGGDFTDFSDSDAAEALTAEEIRKIPVVKITANQAQSQLECSICLEFFAVNENVKKLFCDHHFHEVCVAPWLRINATCPICRNNVTLGFEDVTSSSADEENDADDEVIEIDDSDGIAEGVLEISSGFSFVDSETDESLFTQESHITLDLREGDVPELMDVDTCSDSDQQEISSVDMSNDEVVELSSTNSENVDEY